MAETKPNGNHKSEMWTKVITGVVGAALLGLQGVNISETSGQTAYIQRMDRALEQQVSVVKSLNQESERIDQALENQKHMIESMETMVRNQQATLELLQNKKSP